jgi:hypothetical protein
MKDRDLFLHAILRGYNNARIAAGIQRVDAVLQDIKSADAVSGVSVQPVGIKLDDREAAIRPVIGLN